MLSYFFLRHSDVRAKLTPKEPDQIFPFSILFLWENSHVY